MKFAGKVHKIVVELTILSATPPDDAGFDMTKSWDGEFARMRVVSREELPLDSAKKLIEELGGDPEVMK